MVGERNQQRVCRRRNRTNTYTNRGVHLAVGFLVYNASYTQTIYPRPNFFRSMAQYYNNGFYAASAQVVDAGFDDGLFAEGKQWLEGAHPF